MVPIMKNPLKKLSWTVSLALLFTGCASYDASGLSALDPDCVRSYGEVDGMAIGCKAFNRDDCLHYLGRDVLAKGYQPIQLTFQNMTGKRFIYSTREISLPCSCPDEVGKRVHTSTFGRIFLYAPLVIPALIDGIKSSQANHTLDIDYHEKAPDHFVISPHSYFKTLIFVPKAHFSPVFDISLLDQETGKKKVVGLSIL
jgi:hypothetical protein